jgi:hypothetical protein
MVINNIKYAQLIKPLRTPLIRDTLNSMESYEWSPHDQQFTFVERLAPIDVLRSNILNWASNHLVGLGQFDHMYVLNGNTDRIDKLFDTIPDTAHIAGDYGYYGKRQSTHSQPQSTLPTIPLPLSNHPNNAIVTWPGYSHGDRTQLNQILAHNPTHLHLDCAYLGLVRSDARLNIDRFDTVAISFSKTLAIPFNRISVLFTRTPDPKLELLNSIGYVNLSGVHIVNKLLNTLHSTYWNDLCDPKYEQLCSASALAPTNCYLFAVNQNGVRVSTAPYWRLLYPHDFV